MRPLGAALARWVPTTLGARMMEAVATPPTTFRLTPRPYQYEAVAALLAATARGVHRPLLVLPTGTGKTIVFALLVQRRRGRSLILAHRDELIQQAVDKLHLVDPSLPGSVGWKWKAGAYPQQTGCSTSKSSPRVALSR